MHGHTTQSQPIPLQRTDYLLTIDSECIVGYNFMTLYSSLFIEPASMEVVSCTSIPSLMDHITVT